MPCVVAPSFTCGTSTVSDVDNNSYNTVLIGTQCWTKENLKVTKYNDNTPIPLDATQTSPTDGTSPTWQNWDIGRYSIYANEASSGANSTNYGFLYNWYAAAGIITSGGATTKNICPVGWKVPTDAQWTALITQLGGRVGAGGKMKQIGTGLWNTPNTGADNTSNFTALPGGYRHADGRFLNIKDEAFFWSDEQNSSNTAWSRDLYRQFIYVDRSFYLKSYGYSVRCLKN